MTVQVLEGDCRVLMAAMEPDSFDSIVTDPPSGIHFMGRDWDHDRGGRQQWIAWMTEIMRECYRVLKPGGHAVVWALPRTSHWSATAIEDAGFDVRDIVMHLFGSGFPKSLDVSKAIDKRGGAEIGWFGPWLREERERRGITQKSLARHFPSKTGGLTGCVANWELGLNLPTVEQFNALCEVLGLPFERIEEAEREVIAAGNDKGRTQTFGGTTAKATVVTAPATDAARKWAGWGTALKPAAEHWILARKPLSESTVAANVLKHGTGTLNIDGCRIGTTDDLNGGRYSDNKVGADGNSYGSGINSRSRLDYEQPTGRWPANLVLDEESARLLDEQSGERPAGVAVNRNLDGSDRNTLYQGGWRKEQREDVGYSDTGGASRFFYTAKASRAERSERVRQVGGTNIHPTVKPVDLMRWLCRLVTRPGGHILDPFVGSGSTLVAALMEGFDATGIDLNPEYVAIARQRIDGIQLGGLVA